MKISSTPLFPRFPLLFPPRISLLLPLFTFHFSLFTPAPAASPRLACDAPAFDAGPVPPAPLSHDFILRNDGQIPLEIRNARASTGGFRLSPPRHPILPGDSAALRADFTPAKRSGPHSGTIVVSSNDPDTPMFFLSFRCDVVLPPTADPAFLHFGRLTDPADATRTVTISADRPFTVLSASAVRPQVTVETDSASPAPTHVLTVTILPSMSPGPFGDTLTVELDLPAHPPLQIPLIGDWRPPVPPSP